MRVIYTRIHFNRQSRDNATMPGPRLMWGNATDITEVVKLLFFFCFVSFSLTPSTQTIIEI